MIFLNKGCGNYPCKVPAEPNVWTFEFRGRSYAWDANSMLLALLEEEEGVPVGHACDWKPNFDLPRPACGHLVLEVTDACNLACSYCFVAEDGDRSREKVNMNFSTAAQAICNFFVANGQAEQIRRSRHRTVSIGFFGGEPLLRKDLIREVVDFAESSFGREKCRFHVTTNGTLIDEEWATFVSQHGFSFIVSIDGPQVLHDAERKHRDGSGSYKEAMAGLNWLRMVAPNAVKSTTLRSTYTKMSKGTLVDRLEHLNTLCDRQFGSSVSVEPAFLGENVCFDKTKAAAMTPNLTTEDGARWVQQLHEAADWYIKRIRAGQRARYHHFTMKVRRLLQGHPQPSECGAGKGYFSIGADGTIYGCHRETCTKVGHIRHGGIDHELAAPWQDNRYYSRKNCPACHMRNICGGGCREVSGVHSGDITQPVRSECAHKFIWFKEAAHILAELHGDDQLRPHLLKNVGLGERKCATR